MVKKIALEEHFLDPATEPYWRPTMVDVAPAKTAQLYDALTSFGEQRLAMMDKTGIARAVLAIAGPGVQVERDAAAAVRNARASNDFLAKEVQKRPDRYSGFAHLAMQDAKAAADELERCVGRLFQEQPSIACLESRSCRTRDIVQTERVAAEQLVSFDIAYQKLDSDLLDFKSSRWDERHEVSVRIVQRQRRMHVFPCDQELIVAAGWRLG